MSKRTITPNSPTGFVLSGDLKSVLHTHAIRRAHNYFNYLFYMKVLVNHLNAKDSTLRLGAADGVNVAATEQFDQGYRRGGSSAARSFDSADPGVLNTMATDFKSVDAAHTCNLGIAPDFVGKISPHVSLASAASDPIPHKYFEALKAMSGSTQHLPQRVNIGPDRVIDVMHGDLAPQMLSANTPKLASQDNVLAYRDAAVARMEEYRDGKRKDGDHGVAACADCYLDVYRDIGVPTREEIRATHIHYERQVAALQGGQALPPSPTAPSRVLFVESVFRAIKDEVKAACGASGGRLKVEDYLT